MLRPMLDKPVCEVQMDMKLRIGLRLAMMAGLSYYLALQL